MEDLFFGGINIALYVVVGIPITFAIVGMFLLFVRISDAITSKGMPPCSRIEDGILETNLSLAQKITSFLVPVVGLVLGIIYISKDEKKSSDSAFGYAAAGFIAALVIFIIFKIQEG